MCLMSKSKDKQVNPGQVIFPVNHPDPPQQHEIDVAYILARHYRTAVEFLIPVYDYADVIIGINPRGLENTGVSPI